MICWVGRSWSTHPSHPFLKATHILLSVSPNLMPSLCFKFIFHRSLCLFVHHWIIIITSMSIHPFFFHIPMAHHTTAPTSSATHYDVFISHRDRDVKKSFAGHLYHSLNSRGLSLSWPTIIRTHYSSSLCPCSDFLYKLCQIEIVPRWACPHGGVGKVGGYHSSCILQC